MPTAPPSRIRALEARLWRVLLVVGLGFFAFFLGAILSAGLRVRIEQRLEMLGVSAVTFVVLAVVANLWLLLVLPVLCYGVARVLELKPSATAVGAVLTGELFLLAISLISNGLESVIVDPANLVMRIASLAFGIWATRVAVIRARLATGRADERARLAAEARKSEYSDFAAAAERLGARHEAATRKENAAGSIAVAAVSPGEVAPGAVEQGATGAIAPATMKQDPPAAVKQNPTGNDAPFRVEQEPPEE